MDGLIKNVYEKGDGSLLYPITTGESVYVNSDSTTKTLDLKLAEIDAELARLKGNISSVENNMNSVIPGTQFWMEYYKLIKSDRKTAGGEFAFNRPANFNPGYSVPSDTGEPWTTAIIPESQEVDGNYVWKYLVLCERKDSKITYLGQQQGPFRAYSTNVDPNGIAMVAAQLFLITDLASVTPPNKKTYLGARYDSIPSFTEGVWSRTDMSYLLLKEEYTNKTMYSYSCDIIVKYEKGIGTINSIGDPYRLLQSSPPQTLGAKGVLGQSCRIRLLSALIEKINNSEEVWAFPSGDDYDYINVIRDSDDIIEYLGHAYTKFYDIIVDDVNDPNDLTYYLALKQNPIPGFKIIDSIGLSSGGTVSINNLYWSEAEEYNLLKAEVAIILNVVASTVDAGRILITSSSPTGGTTLHAGLLNGSETLDVIKKFVGDKELSDSTSLDTSSTKIRFFAGLNAEDDTEHKGEGFALNGDISKLNLHNSNFYITADGTVYARNLKIILDTEDNALLIQDMVSGTKASKRVTTFALLDNFTYIKSDFENEIDDNIMGIEWSPNRPVYTLGNANKYIWQRVKYYNVNDISNANLIETVYEYIGDASKIEGVPGQTGDAYKLSLSLKLFTKENIQAGTAKVTAQLFKIPAGNTNDTLQVEAYFACTAGTASPLTWEGPELNAEFTIPNNPVDTYTIWAKLGNYTDHESIGILYTPLSINTEEAFAYFNFALANTSVLVAHNDWKADPAPVKGQYRWRRYKTQIKYINGTGESVVLLPESGYYYECVGYCGTDGANSYTWIRYAKDVDWNADGSVATITGVTDYPTKDTYYIGMKYNQQTPEPGNISTEELYTQFKWVSYSGKNGTTYYTWIRYSDKPDPTSADIFDSPVKKDGTFLQYIGFGYNKPTQKESDNPKDYIWTRITGEEGQPGPPGPDGTTYYTWIKYSDVEPTSETPIYDNPKDTTEYIGIAINQTSETESTDPSKYTWSKFKGDLGVAGKDGLSIVGHNVWFLLAHKNNTGAPTADQKLQTDMWTTADGATINPTQSAWVENVSPVTTETWKYLWSKSQEIFIDPDGQLVYGNPIIKLEGTHGERGRDGDGYNYIYCLVDGEYTPTAPSVKYNGDWENSNRNPIITDYDVRRESGETPGFTGSRPSGIIDVEETTDTIELFGPLYCSERKIITFKPSEYALSVYDFSLGNNPVLPFIWYDEQPPMDAPGQKIYISESKYSGEEKRWSAFSDAALHARWSKDGNHGDSPYSIRNDNGSHVVQADYNGNLITNWKTGIGCNILVTHGNELLTLAKTYPRNLVNASSILQAYEDYTNNSGFTKGSYIIMWETTNVTVGKTLAVSSDSTTVTIPDNAYSNITADTALVKFTVKIKVDDDQFIELTTTQSISKVRGGNPGPSLPAALVARIRAYNEIPNTDRFYAYEQNSQYEYYDIVTIVVGKNIKYYKYIGTQGKTKELAGTPGVDSDWTEAEEHDFLLVNTLVATTLTAELGDFLKLLIKSKANGKVVAGMLGWNNDYNKEQTENISSSTTSPEISLLALNDADEDTTEVTPGGDETALITRHVKIFAGSSIPNLAPFRVYDDGKVVANNLELSNSMKLAIHNEAASAAAGKPLELFLISGFCIMNPSEIEQRWGNSDQWNSTFLDYSLDYPYVYRRYTYNSNEVPIKWTYELHSDCVPKATPMTLDLWDSFCRNSDAALKVNGGGVFNGDVAATSFSFMNEATPVAGFDYIAKELPLEDGSTLPAGSLVLWLLVGEKRKYLPLTAFKEVQETASYIVDGFTEITAYIVDGFKKVLNVTTIYRRDNEYYSTNWTDTATKNDNKISGSTLESYYIKTEEENVFTINSNNLLNTYVRKKLSKITNPSSYLYDGGEARNSSVTLDSQWSNIVHGFAQTAAQGKPVTLEHILFVSNLLTTVTGVTEWNLYTTIPQYTQLYEDPGTYTVLTTNRLIEIIRSKYNW